MTSPDFKTRKALSEPYEMEACKRALAYINKTTSQNSQYRLTKRQNDSNYRQTHYDFELTCTSTGDGLTFEVKADAVSRRTGNFFIEYKQYGKASGTAITTAEYHVITNEVEYLMIRTDTLRQIFNEANQPKYHKSPRTGRRTEGQVIPVNRFLAESARLALVPSSKESDAEFEQQFMALQKCVHRAVI